MGPPSPTRSRKARAPRHLDPGALHVRIVDALLRAPGATRVKPGILHRTAQKIAAAVLSSRVSSTDPVHFATLDLVYRLDDAADPRLQQAVLAIGRWVVRGRVLPIQRLHELLDEARAIHLARCPCRASGRVRDRPGKDPPPPRASDEDPAADEARDEGLLRRILDAWSDPGVREGTSPHTAEALDEVVRARKAGGPEGRLEDLLAATWPYWELLIEHPGYDRCWLEGLAKNGKVRRLAPALAHAWVDALYRGRHVVFTHMEAAGLPYAICSCPGPETDGGCMLTNWHYLSGNDEILVPNEGLAHGRRRGARGEVLTCARHPGREGRPCLGCGCDHEAEQRGTAGGGT
jgi:hypothetical protein